MTSMARPTVRLDRPELSATIEEIRDAVADGAGSDVVARWTAEATREAGGGRDRLAVLRRLADRVREAVTFGFDEYGGEDVQGVETTLEGRRVGDCDDFAVAVLSLARRIGLRPGLAIASVDGRAKHVTPIVEDPASGRWIPVELTVDEPFGRLPIVSSSRAVEWDAYPLQEGEGALSLVGGLFDGIIGGIAGFFTAKENNKAAKSIAKSNVKAAETTAAANVEVARQATAAEQARVRADLEKFSGALAFAKKSLPLVAGVLALGILVPALTYRRRAPARRPAAA